ncbi:M28 family metallopeptidase [Nocardioides cremeus]|uniref:M28 family metallopeptidase n=1 Tax=Nocardioides cremeus TaxID=3058044 RepID=UPI0026716BEA|nr:M28 family peptidase [Nocardioides cremeus]
MPALAVTTAAALVAGGVGFTANADDDTTTIQAAERGKNGSAGGFDLPKQLTKRVKGDGIDEHLDKLQEISDKFDGNRASGTPGYNASVRYIVRTLTKAGYTPEVQAFDFAYFVENAPAELAQTSPDATTYATPEDFSSMTYSGSGDVTAAVVAVDTDGTANAASTSGCEAEDFAAFPEGSIALIQRGSCAFGQKALNAQEAGAAGVIIFNAGVEGRTDSFVGTLGQPGYEIPVVGTSFAVGQDLIDPAGTEVRLFADTTSEIRETYNVLAETRGGDKDNVVMVGSHLDSVPEGPGINDNGSGSASILETALKLSKFDKKGKKKGHGKKAKGKGKGKLENQVRFAWWGAEELGLLGSEHYVAELSQEEIDEIALYLNFDMVGSPNYVRFVYDGDNSEGGGAVGPAGSDDIEEMFNEFFASEGLESEATPFSGRSDYGPFIVEGVDIPSGGLFTGAEGVKTEEQAAIYGGEAGVAYDPCYHAECDDRDNVSMDAIDEMSNAIAHSVATYAVSTEGLGEDSPAPAPRMSKAERKAAEKAARNAELHPAHDHSDGLRR